MPVSLPLESSETSRLSRGYLIAVAATVIWSTTAIFIRYLQVTYSVPPLVLAFWRDLFTALGTFLGLLVIRSSLIKIPFGQARFLVIYGLVLAVFNGLWTISVLFNGAAISTVLAYSSAAFTAILGWKLFNERLDWAKITAVLFSLIGCVFVSGAYDLAVWKGNPIGILAGLFSGLMFAVYSLMGRSAAKRGINPWTTLMYSFGFGAGFLLLINQMPIFLLDSWISHPGDLFWLQSEWIAWGILIFFAIGPTLAGYGLYAVSLVYLPASVANLIATLEPAFTAVMAYFLFGEMFTPPQWLGSLLILIGVVFLRIYEGRLELAGVPG